MHPGIRLEDSLILILHKFACIAVFSIDVIFVERGGFLMMCFSVTPGTALVKVVSMGKFERLLFDYNNFCCHGNLSCSSIALSYVEAEDDINKPFGI